MQKRLFIKSVSIEEVQTFFIHNYSGDISPFSPYFILSVPLRVLIGSGNVTIILINWRLLLKSENQDEVSRLIAKITFLEVPKGIFVAFDYEEKPEIDDCVKRVTKKISSDMRKAGYKVTIYTGSSRERGKPPGPTDTTIARAEALKKLKTEHPEWTMQKLAMEYNALHGGDLNESMVRQAYRSMDWPWKRGSREQFH